MQPFFIDHDGRDTEYAAYGISKEEEAEWRKEYIALWVSRLSAEDLTAVNRLCDAWAVEALPNLMKHSDEGDDF
jgi:hypothetical protein